MNLSGIYLKKFSAAFFASLLLLVHTARLVHYHPSFSIKSKTELAKIHSFGSISIQVSHPKVCEICQFHLGKDVDSDVTVYSLEKYNRLTFYIHTELSFSTIKISDYYSERGPPTIA